MANINSSASFDSLIARGANFLADSAEFVFKRGGRAIIPGALGAAGGWLVGVGPRIGMFQGVASGTLFSWVFVPIGKYISKHSGKGENQIHPNARNMSCTAMAVAQAVMPIYLTVNYGAAFLDKLGSRLPSMISWIVAPVSGESYTYTRGLFTSIAPVVTQFGLEWLLSRDPKQSGSY